MDENKDILITSDEHATNQRTVHIEPPITDEVLLVVKSTIRTEHGGDEPSLLPTDVVGLTVRLLVSIVTIHQLRAEEGSGWGHRVGRVVLASYTRYRAYVMQEVRSKTVRILLPLIAISKLKFTFWLQTIIDLSISSNGTFIPQNIKRWGSL